MDLHEKKVVVSFQTPRIPIKMWKKTDTSISSQAKKLLTED